MTAQVGGSGGGRDPQLAQGAGSDASALPAAFAAVESLIAGAGR